MNKKSNFVVIILLLITIVASLTVYPQTVYTPLNSSIYNYLDRLATEHIIVLNDEVKPYSRKMIAGYLIKASEKSAMLNKVEKEELEWYKEEYAEEMKLKNERWFLYKHSDSLFSIRVTPVGGYGISRIGDAHGHTRWWGISTYGNISDLLGVSFSYKDIGQFGGNVDYKKDFTPERAYDINSNPSGGIEFSDVKAAVNFAWNWGSVSLIKDDIRWGHGNFGQLILSDKPESYPQIRLFIKPAEWFRLYYIHGWLNSLVYDSSKFYYNHLESVHPIQYKSYINKYIAANMLTVTPLNNLDVSIGNSVIYSGELRSEFFIPFLYYKVMDHNTGRGDVEDSNGQIYFDISSRNLQNYQFYSTIFIDCGSIRGLLKGDLHEWWCGYTLGVKTVNVFIPNLDLIVEYTKLGPWVYEHKYDTETYKHIGVTLGDWLGQNADQFRIQADYKLSRPLAIHLYFERLRKGGLADNSFAYFSTVTIPFLYGPLRKDFNIGIAADYEIFHDLYASGLYEYSNITDGDKTRTQKFLLGDKNNLSFKLSLGL